MALTIVVAASDVVFAIEPQTSVGHDQAQCNQCHFGTATADNKGQNERCLSCHARPHGQSAGLTLARANKSASSNTTTAIDAGRKCVDCHSFHEPWQIVTAAGTLDLVQLAQVDRAHCAACHNNGAQLGAISEAHRQAAALYHGDSSKLAGASPSQGCLNCHDKNSDSPWQAATTGAPLTLYSHASHAVGVLVRPGSGTPGNRIRLDLDPRIPLFDGRLECSSCHLLTAETADLLIEFQQPKDLCLGCHQLHDKKEPDNELPVSRRPTIAASLTG